MNESSREKDDSKVKKMNKALGIETFTKIGPQRKFEAFRPNAITTKKESSEKLNIVEEMRNKNKREFGHFGSL